MKRDLPPIEFTPLPEAREIPGEFGWRMWERACREMGPAAAKRGAPARVGGYAEIGADLMKRTPMKRKTPLRQRRATGPDIEREPRPSALSTLKPLRRGTYAGGTTGPAPKPQPMLQHSGYMAAVRALGYCMRCRCSCQPQFCHRDQGKGMGLKTDVREGWPGCAECHWMVGTSGQYPKEERRALELELGRRTRAAVTAAGTWPARLPMWSET